MPNRSCPGPPWSSQAGCQSLVGPLGRPRVLSASPPRLSYRSAAAMFSLSPWFDGIPSSRNRSLRRFSSIGLRQVIAIKAALVFPHGPDHPRHLVRQGHGRPVLMPCIGSLQCPALKAAERLSYSSAELRREESGASVEDEEHALEDSRGVRPSQLARWRPLWNACTFPTEAYSAVVVRVRSPGSAVALRASAFRVRPAPARLRPPGSVSGLSVSPRASSGTRRHTPDLFSRYRGCAARTAAHSSGICSNWKWEEYPRQGLEPIDC
jgi:hypothetical protein